MHQMANTMRADQTAQNPCRSVMVALNFSFKVVRL